jgi:hypothetical protein
VRFFYRPHFLQGGTDLQLRLVLPAIKVARIDSATKATCRPTTLPANFPGINFYGEAAELPTDFQVYVLGIRTQPNEAEMEYAYGVAVSIKREEVIYWIEN